MIRKSKQIQPIHSILQLDFRDEELVSYGGSDLFESFQNLAKQIEKNKKNDITIIQCNQGIDIVILKTEKNCIAEIPLEIFSPSSIVFLFTNNENFTYDYKENIQNNIKLQSDHLDSISLILRISKFKLSEIFNYEYLFKFHPQLFEFINNKDKRNLFFNFKKLNHYTVNRYIKEIDTNIIKLKERGKYSHYQAISYICNILKENEFHPEKLNNIRKEDVVKLKRVEEIIKSSYQAMFPIKQIAKIVNLSEVKLKNDFKKLYGLPPYQYFLSYRLNIAHSMISKEGKSITEVTNLIGYESSSKFAKAFKKQFGIAPNQIKNQRE